MVMVILIVIRTVIDIVLQMLSVAPAIASGIYQVVHSAILAHIVGLTVSEDALLTKIVAPAIVSGF